MNESITQQSLNDVASQMQQQPAVSTPPVLSEQTLEDVAKSMKAQQAPFYKQFGAGLLRTPEVIGRAFERAGAQANIPFLSLPFKIAEGLAKMGVKPADPIQKITEPFVGTFGEGLGEFLGSLAIPELGIGRLAGGAALGLTGALGQQQAPTQAQALGGMTLGTGLGAASKVVEPFAGKLAAAAGKSKFARGVGNVFNEYMQRLRSDLSPIEANQELQKIASQRDQANSFMNNLSGGLPESAQPERLRSAVTDLDKNISAKAAEKYNDAYDSAREGGNFGMVFPTASKNAKELLEKETELLNRGVPQVDVDKINNILAGLVRGGELRNAQGEIIRAKRQTFESGTETMKRLRELAQKYNFEKNRTVSSMLGSLANNVEDDLGNALENTDAISKWKEANNYWKTNALPLRTEGIQNAVKGAAEIGNLHKELLNFDNTALPSVLNQLNENGKKALAFQAFKDSVEFNPTTERREANPSKLLNIFDKQYSGQNKPFIESAVGDEGLNDLSNMQKNQLIGVNDKIENLSKGLSKSGNAQKIERLSAPEKNLILFNHLKGALDGNNELDTKQFTRLVDKIDPSVRNALFSHDKNSENIFNSIDQFSRMENTRLKTGRLNAPTGREFLRKLADIAQTIGVPTTFFHPALGASLGLSSLIARALQGRVPAERLTPIVANILRRLNVAAGSLRGVPIIAGRPSRERG